MKKSSLKLNDGCIKIFKFIILLYEDNATYKNVINIFQNEVEENSKNNIQVVLNKYLNTLKIFGMKVKKKNNKYKLESSLYSMNFTNDDLKSISMLIKFSESFPDEKVKENVKTFLYSLLLRMNNTDKNKLNDLNNIYDFSFYYSDMKDQIEKCENIIRDNYLINIIYLSNNEKIKCRCTPKEVIYDSKIVYLQVYDNLKNEKIDIPITNILSIERLPQKANPRELTTTVVYKLKNRLAKSYKLKDNERSGGFDEDGNQIIINNNEPFDKLFARLMRYSYSCEIISPKYCRQKMTDLISKTLNLYSE